MKTEIFSLKDKGTRFAKARSMHDCSFTVSYENDTLILVFDHPEQYFGPAPGGPWFDNHQKCTVKYRNVKYLCLTLKYRKKEKNYFDTVEALTEKEPIMFKFSVDSFDHMYLDFLVEIKKKLWGGILEMTPEEIEYIWE